MDKEKVIDFNELKDRVNDSDIDKFEGYMFDLFYKMQGGTMDMSAYMLEISKYMTENNISEKKFLEIQKKMMARYGLDLGDLGNLESLNNNPLGYEDVRKKLSFEEKYNKKIEKKVVEEYKIKNTINDVVILLQGRDVTIISEGIVELNDNELNEFLCSYKKVQKDEPLNIKICNNLKEYNY